MNTINRTNGQQPPLPGQQPIQIKFNSNSTTKEDKPKICRDYVWGKCYKNTQCRFRHELVFEEVKEIIKFCHDYQNPSGCSRDHCTYLHTTKEEETLFLNEQKLPRVLVERHDLLLMPPPLPPMRPPMPYVGMAPMLPVPKLLPPPPPPPPPTQPSASVPPQNPTYTAPLTQGTSPSFALPQQPAVADFNPSVPPPMPVAQLKNGAVKRCLNSDAGASKKTKQTEDCIGADTQCEECLQFVRSIEEYKDEINRVSMEEEYFTLMYRERFENYAKRKELLRSLVDADMYRFLEECVEGVSRLDLLSQLNLTSLLTATSSIPKQLMMQRLDFMVGNSRSIESVNPSMRLEELLSAVGRRGTAGAGPGAAGGGDSLRTTLSILELLASRSGSSSPLTSANGDVESWLARLSPAPGAPPPAPHYAAVAPNVTAAPVAPAAPVPSYYPPAPHYAPTGAAPPPASPAPAFYQPGVPPPSNYRHAPHPAYTTTQTRSAASSRQKNCHS